MPDSAFTQPQPDEAAPGKGCLVGAVFLVLVAVIIAGFAIGGEAASFVQAGLQALPFAPLAVLAYLGVHRAWARLLALLWLGLLVAGVAAFTLGGTAAVLSGGPADGVALPPGAWGKLALVALGNLVAVALGLACFLPGVRLRLSRHLPLDPDYFVHTIALVAVVTLTVQSFAPLAVLGEPPLIAVVSMLIDEGMDLMGDQDVSAVLRADLYALAWLIPVAFLSVGFGIRRGWRATLRRLGLVRPTGRQVLAALALVLVLLAGVSVLSLAIDWLWRVMGWPRTGGEAFEQAFSALLGAFLSPVGAVVFAVTAGLGEEVAVRGVLQPRLGILLSNLFFTGLHAFQYNWDSLLIVFLLGIALGIIRQRSNTTVSAIVHAGYDFVLIMMLVIGGPALGGS